MDTVKLSVIAVLLILSSAAWSQDQRLKVEGIWDGQTLQVDRIKPRDPDKDVRRIRVSGAVSRISQLDRTVDIGPARMHWQSSQAEALSTVRVGDIVRVDAVQSSYENFTIVNIERTDVDSSESIELIGALTGFSSDEGWTELRLAGIPVRTPRRLFNNGRLGLQRLDDKRPENQFTTNIGGVRTTIGGEFGVKVDADGNRDLDKDDVDDQLDADAELQLEVFFELSETVSGFAELKVERSQRYDIPLSLQRSEFNLDRGELWVYFDQPFGLPAGLQIGRQNFAENREWWWDTDLDALRVYVTYPRFRLEFAIAKEVGRVTLTDDHADAEDQDITRFLARGSYRLNSKLTLDTFYLHQNDHSSSFDFGDILPSHREDEEDADLTWIGARFTGELDLFDDFDTEYWFDIARVSGEETRYDFNELADGDLSIQGVTEAHRTGTALDMGGTITWSDIRIGPFSEPAVTLGYAVGSGDDDINGTFRQTGLNDNNGKYNGVDRFRYYGELVRPELENLRVSTASFGLSFNDESSIELIFHNYKQDHLSIRHPLRIDQPANGDSSELGNEVNLVVGIEEWEHVELEGVGGIFFPGEAFDENERAWFVAMKMNYNF